MRFGQDIRSADIKQEPCKKTQKDYQNRRGQVEHEESAALRVVMREHQADGIDSVAEIMRDNGEGYDKAGACRNLEGDANANTIHNAMADERAGREDADMGMVMCCVGTFLRMVHQHEFFEAVKEKKPEHEGDHGVHRVRPMFVRQLENFRQDIEADDTNQHAGSKAEDIMQPVVMLKRK